LDLSSELSRERIAPLDGRGFSDAPRTVVVRVQHLKMRLV